MSGNINKVILVGRLGRDPELRQLNNGDSVANLSVATSEQWRDKSGEKQERTEWHRVVVFKHAADFAAKYLSKGDPVYVEGKIQTRKWTDKEGNDRYSTEIMAQQLQALSTSGRGDDDRGEDAPPVRKPKPATTKGPKAEKPAPAEADEDFDDDVPF